VARAVPSVPSHARSLSAVTFSAAARFTGADAYHTVCFGRDYPEEFEALFGARRMPEDPTVYLCAPDHAAGEDAVGRVLIVMNAPADGDTSHYDEKDIERCRQQAMATLERCGLTLDFTTSKATSPADFAALLPATVGALLAEAGYDAPAVLAAAGEPEAAAAYARNRDDAIAAGVFGAPSWVVDGEVFWGQDRLELLDAMLASQREAYRAA